MFLLTFLQRNKGQPATVAKPMRRLVWDLPTRIFHWTLVASFIGAYLTGEDDHYAVLHVTCGFTIFGLLLFRIIWGFAGSRYAIFSSFIKGPKEIIGYLRSLVSSKKERWVGHNPAGGISILSLLILGLISTISGWIEYEDINVPRIEQIHEWASFTMLSLVIIHFIAVLLSSLLFKDNLIRSMFDGTKDIEKEQSIRHKYPIIGALLFALILGFWVWTYRLNVTRYF